MDGTTATARKRTGAISFIPLHHPDDHRQNRFVFVDVAGRDQYCAMPMAAEYIDGLSGLWERSTSATPWRSWRNAASARCGRISSASAYIGATNDRQCVSPYNLPPHASRVPPPSMSTTAEAPILNESSFKFARYTGKVKTIRIRRKIISRIHAYHGVTMAVD